MNMKKIICILLLSVLCFTALSEGSEGISGSGVNMAVINCEEWVSLRVTPSRSADRLLEVPLGAVVTNCEEMDGEFTYCEYEGKCGYILDEYLEIVPVLPTEPNGAAVFERGDFTSDHIILNETFGEYTVVASRFESTYGSDYELLNVACFRNDLDFVWGYTTHTDFITELQLTDCFISGTKEAPYVGVYNCMYGLTAFEIETGEMRFDLTYNFGASNVYTTGEDGTLYIAGFYGPDPVAVSAVGKVLWCSSVEDEDIYWPYCITLRSDGLLVDYDSPAEGGHYIVLFDFNGVKQWSRID